MKIVDIKTKIIPSNPRSKNYPIGYSGGIASNSNGVTPDLSIYLLKEIWERNIEERTDESGNEYLYIRKPLAIGGGATMYASNGVVVPSIFDGLPLDNTTIRKNPETGLIEVIGGTGTSFDENAMWSALSGSSDNQINKSHLTTALDGYATQNWVIENYATKSELSAVSNKLNDFLEGSDTDTIINKWKELEAFLSGMAETDNLAEILETKADRSYVDSTFVTLATKQTITGEKTFSSVLNTVAIKASGEITTPSLAASNYVTIAGIKLRKLEDGALMLEGNLALTGGLTTYASDGVSFPSIYDGLPIDNDTIYWQEVEGSKVLKAKEGSGSSFDKSAMWNALAGSTTEQINKTHLTTALDNYPTKTGSGASGTWGIGIIGNAATASKWATARTITLGSYLSGAVSLDGSANVTLNANVIGLTSQGKKAAVSGTTFQEVGVRLYEVFENGYPTNYGNLLSVRGGGCGELLLAWKDQYSRIYYRSKADSGNDSWTNWNTVAFLTDNIASATKLQTARTLWGQSFNGEKNVSGNLSNVGNIVPSSDNTYTLGNATNHFEGAYVRVLRNNINREMIIAQNAANNLVFQTSGVNRVIISSDGNLRMGDSFIISEATQDTTYRVRIKTESYNPYISFNQSGNTWFVQGYNNKLYLGSTSEKSINIDSEGNLYSPQNITASKVVSAAAFKGNRVRIECDDAGTPDVRRSEINNFQANLYLQHATSNNLICCNGGGKVGIGTTSPSYKLHVNGNVAVNTGVNVYGMTGSSWGAGNGAYEIQIPTNSQQTPILLAYDINGGRTGTSRYFSIEILNGSNRNVRMLVQGQHVIELLPSKVTILKDLLVEGGCTFYESDQRAKNIIGLVDLSLKQICEAPTIRFRWNGWHTKDDGRNHVGGIAQYIQGILPEAIINSDKTLSMDYATVAYTFAVHTARHLMNYETRTDKKIKKLEREIVILKKQLKKLGYEEVRTLDDSGI